MLLLFVPVQLNAENEKSTGSIAGVTNAETKSNAVDETYAAESAKSDAQLNRLEEINAMDLSTLSRSEKNELREEVKSIEKDQPQWSRSHRHDNYDGRTEDNGPRRHNARGSIFIFGGTGLILLLLLLLLL